MLHDARYFTWAGAGIITLFLFLAYRVFIHRLARIPGPTSWAISRARLAWSLRQGKLAQELKVLHDRYGPVVRISPDEVSFIDEAAWNAFYAYRQGYPLPKNPYWYRERLHNKTTGIMSSSKAEHPRFRRAVGPAFTHKAVREQETLLIHHIDKLMDQLRTKATKDKSVDMLDWFDYLAFDIVGDYSLSVLFNLLDSVKNRPLVNASRKVLEAFTQSAVPRILGLDFMRRFVIPMDAQRKRFIYDTNVNQHVSERATKDQVHEKDDLITHVLARPTGKGLTTVEMQNAAADVVTAGSEAVSTTLCSIIFHLAKDEKVQRRLASEIRGAFEEETQIGIDSCAKLTYLNAVVDEAMRICPALPSVLPRVVTEPGLNICGYWLPAGTFVTFAPLAAYLSATHFKYPEEFLPDRWLPDSDMKPHHSQIFHPFSIGPRDCVGKLLGMAEVRLTISKLIWNFDIESAVPEEVLWKWCDQRSFLAWDKKPLNIKLNIATRERCS